MLLFAWVKYHIEVKIFDNDTINCYIEPEVMKMDMVENEIIVLQENLEMLRKLFGWSAEQLGNRLGVTKQTVLNLEHGKPTMSKIQYIAIRAVFEIEACRREEEEKKFLFNVLNLVFNDNGSVSDESRQNALDVAKVMANATVSTKNKSMVTKTIATTFAAFGIALLTPMPFAATWLMALLKAEDDRK